MYNRPLILINKHVMISWWNHGEIELYQETVEGAHNHTQHHSIPGDAYLFYSRTDLKNFIRQINEELAKSMPG